MTPHVTVRCRVGRGERADYRMLATRALRTLVLRYGRFKLVLRCVDFWVPYKIGGNTREMAPYGAVLRRAGRVDRGCRRVS